MVCYLRLLASVRKWFVGGGCSVWSSPFIERRLLSTSVLQVQESFNWLYVFVRSEVSLPLGNFYPFSFLY